MDPPFHGGLTPLAHRRDAWGGYPGSPNPGGICSKGGAFNVDPPFHGGLTPLAHRRGAWGGYPGRTGGSIGPKPLRYLLQRGGFQRGPPLSCGANPLRLGRRAF